MKTRLSIFLCAFLKNHHFSFLWVVLSIHELQNYDNVLRQVCDPVLDLDNTTKSFAYRSEFSFAPFDRTNGSQFIFLSKRS